MAEEEKLAERGQRPLVGRIFLNANLDVKLKGPQKQRQDINGIISVAPETGQWKFITHGHNARVSPDGKRLVFLRSVIPNKPPHGTSEFWTHDLTTQQTEVRVLDDGENLFASSDRGYLRTGHPALWSSDSKQIVASVSRATADNTHVEFVTRLANRDGSGWTKMSLRETDEVNDWSPDGKWLAVVTKREPPFNSGYQLYRMRPDGSEELRLTKNGLNCYPRFSPDSQKILYLHQTARDGNSLRVIGVNGKGDREIVRENEKGLGSVEDACWSPDGRKLVVVRFDWKLDETGNGTEPVNYRIEIMDNDGTNGHELSLADASIRSVDYPGWR
jgi:Tol biopolymer transport system component